MLQVIGEHVALEFASLGLQSRGGIGGGEDIAFGSQYLVEIALYARTRLGLTVRYIKRDIQGAKKGERY